MIKKILFVAVSIFALSSCQFKEMQEVRIELITAEKLADNPESVSPNWLQDIMKPLYVDSSKVAFIPNVYAKRIDIDSTKLVKVTVDEAFTTSTKRQFNTLTLKDLEADYEESLPKLKAGLIGQKATKSIDIQSYLSNTPSDFVFLTLDSTKSLGKPNEFFSTEDLRKFLIGEFEAGKRNSAKVFVSRGITGVMLGPTKEMLDSVKSFLKEGDYEASSLICNQLSRSSANKSEFKSFAGELVKLADNQFVTIKKLGKAGCDYIPLSMAYVSCAATLYNDGTINNTDRYNSYKNFAKNNCGLITLPAPPSNK